MKLDRRNFIKAASGFALASVAQSLPTFASLSSQVQGQKRKVAVFFEQTFPSVDAVPVDRHALEAALDGYDTIFLGVKELKEQLTGSAFDLLITPYGSAFPKDSWNVILRYLKAGGNWVNLGGVPLSVPIRKGETEWKREVRQTAYHKKLGITQAFPVSTAEIGSYYANPDADGTQGLVGEFKAEEIFEFYVRFTVTKDFPAEDGTAGARDAVLRPLVFGITKEKRRIAAPFLQIDRLQGEFAGGRWLMANFRGVIGAKAVRLLAEMALQGSIELTTRTSFACYRDGEVPFFTVQLRRPKGDVEKLVQGDCRLDVLNEKGRMIETLKVRLQGKGSLVMGTASLSPKKRGSLPPGLYQVYAKVNVSSHSTGKETTVSHTTGFWVLDRKLLGGGKPFTVDENYLLRDGKPYVVTGTTYMISDVHRKFLFEPNPYIWDRDFAEMKQAGINMVRTGIWTAWRNYMLDVGALNEPALRALDAFILTARKYDIPVIFTFFAFIPELWGGENPYLDPRSVNAQKEFVTAFAHRYSEVNDVIWDLINEPSFCSPKHLWSCRPNYDQHEMAAWQKWLKQRYQDTSDDERIAELQEVYRATADELATLPSLEDFSNANIFNENRPIKVIDYRLFAQETFPLWVREMSAAIRSNGNARQLITVGQDEGGTYESPSSQFFCDAVDFTCLHNWWLNDDLVWDNVVTKAPGKPNLVEETGVMFYEKLDGSAWRTEEEARNLLERKLAISLGIGGAGFIEWIWNTNPFMKSDNEAAIGLFRVDGTAKPELQPVIDYAKFFAAHRHLMNGREAEEVVMVIPHSFMFSTRNFATEATRKCVRAMYYHCNKPMSAVSEYRLSSLKHVPKLVVLPSPRTINEEAWTMLLELANKGATVMLTGAFDADDHWIPRPRLAQLGIKAATKPVTQEEFLIIDGVEHQLSFRGEKIQRIEKGSVESESTPSVKMLKHGSGQILWSPIPVEVSDTFDAIVALYKFALRQSKVTAVCALEKPNPSVLVSPTIFEKAVLYTCVSECDRDAKINFVHLESQTPIQLTVPAQRTTLIFVERKTGKILTQLG